MHLCLLPVYFSLYIFFCTVATVANKDVYDKDVQGGPKK